MKRAVRVGVRASIVVALAGVSSLLLRAPLFAAVGRHVDVAVDALAGVAHRLPAPRTLDRSVDVPPPPPPPAIASAIASTAPARSFPTAKKGVSVVAQKGKGAPTNVHGVTRAEVEDAIATKCHGVRASLVRDENGAPIGLALHRVGALARFGIAEGDVLLAANGQSLRTPDEALAALGALKDATRVSVALRRGDATYVVTVEIDDDAQ